MIYHLTTPIEWTMARQQGHYSAPSLDSEGFIHCSTKEQILPVANAFYRTVDELIVLCINEDTLQSLIKWEAPAHPDGSDVDEKDTQKFPHIYGVINLDAVEAFHTMPREQGKGDYQLPEAL